MSCALAELAAQQRPLDFSRYAMLHRDGRALIEGWLKRAQAADDEFESFIYLWIAVNGWAACVTESDADREWQRALIAEPTLNDRFRQIAHDPATRTAPAARGFHRLWPIFRVAELRQRGLDYRTHDDRDRDEAKRAYFAGGARQFEPRCYREHDDVPLDWGHTLVSLYRVRCNLFHGEKARSSESDQAVVSAAFATLLAFVDEGGLMR